MLQCCADSLCLAAHRGKGPVRRGKIIVKKGVSFVVYGCSRIAGSGERFYHTILIQPKRVPASAIASVSRLQFLFRGIRQPGKPGNSAVPGFSARSFFFSIEHSFFPVELQRVSSAEGRPFQRTGTLIYMVNAYSQP
jgi:hypothetical protein